jgi:hypothetical protein
MVLSLKHQYSLAPLKNVEILAFGFPSQPSGLLFV